MRTAEETFKGKKPAGVALIRAHNTYMVKDRYTISRQIYIGAFSHFLETFSMKIPEKTQPRGPKAGCKKKLFHGDANTTSSTSL